MIDVIGTLNFPDHMRYGFSVDGEMPSENG